MGRSVKRGRLRKARHERFAKQHGFAAVKGEVHQRQDLERENRDNPLEVSPDDIEVMGEDAYEDMIIEQVREKFG